MNTIETHALRLIGENVSSPDVFADTTSGLTQIRDSLNDAIRELSGAAACYVREYQLATVADEWKYTLEPTTDLVLYVKAAWDRESHRKLTRTDFIALTQYDSDWLECSGPPDAYCWVGWKYLVLYPVPDVAGRVIDLECVCAPLDYSTSTSAVQLRSQYQRAAVYYAVSEFFASRGDANRANDYFTKYLETAQLMNLNPQSVERQYRYGGQDQQQGANR